MTTTMSVEVTVHRISRGLDDDRGRARQFGPRVVPLVAMPVDNLQYVDVHGADVQSDLAGLKIFSLMPVDEGGWYGGRMLLQINGYDISSPRPFMFYGGPCYVPLHTVFHSPYYGTWVVGLRSTRGAT